MDIKSLTEFIKPAGFSKNKERYLRTALKYFETKIGNLSLPADEREEMLNLRGVGRETADSISLYAFHNRTVPVDSYTIRLLNRYFGSGLSLKDYEMIRNSFVKLFTADELMEFHALIDEHSKLICKKIPNCAGCGLKQECKKNL